MKDRIKKILREEINGVNENIIKNYMDVNYKRLHKNYIHKYDVYLFHATKFGDTLFWYHPWNNSVYLNRNFFNKLKEGLSEYKLENKDIYKLFAQYFEEKYKMDVRTVDPTDREKPILTDRKISDRTYETIPPLNLFYNPPKPKPLPKTDRLTNFTLDNGIKEMYPEDVIRATIQNTDYGLTKFRVLVKPETSVETMKGIKAGIKKLLKKLPLYYYKTLITDPDYLVFFSTDNKVYKTLSK